jgi:uncharacterized membrane protein HdeD (DUF308 family)
MHNVPGVARIPKSIRIADIVLGAITLVLAAAVLAFPSLATLLLVVWIALSLLFAGFEGITVGAAAKRLLRRQRVVRIVSGVVAVILAALVLAIPAAAVVGTIVLLSVGLLFLGGGGIAKGIVEKYMSAWARVMYIIVGGISVALSIAVIANPLFGLLTLFIIVSTVLLINGMSYVIAGVTGMVFVPLAPLPRDGGTNGRKI